MAKELARQAAKSIAVKGPGSLARPAKKSAKHAAKKHAAKHAAKKHAAKKHAKKAAKHTGHSEPDSGLRKRIDSSAREELRRAFHHLQRASAVISLIEPESGGDLKGLLQRGVELYRAASKGGKDASRVRAALGVLRAAEHLAMAGLYVARGVHPLGVHPLNAAPPGKDEGQELARSLGVRLAKLYPASDYGIRLHRLTSELLKRAEAAGDDPHLAWELAAGAEGICVALEEGID